MIIEMICPSCHEKVSINDNKDVGFCFNCGSKILIKAEKKNETISNSQLIENYYNLALTASSAKNNSEAENYCNKILELDPSYYLAWQLKGYSVGWSSSLNNIRLEEASTYYRNAINYAPSDNVKKKIEKSYEKDLENIYLALLDLQCDNFERWPDVEEISKIMLLLQKIVTVSNRKEYYKSVAEKAHKTLIKIWDSTILPEFKNDNGGHPSDSALEKILALRIYISAAFNCIEMLDNENSVRNVLRFYDRIQIIENVMNAQSYDWEYDYAYNKTWHASKSLNASARYELQCEINGLKAKRTEMNNIIKKEEDERERLAKQKLEERERIKEQEKKNRIDSYWKKHADLKAKYDAEKEDLIQQLSKLQKEMDSSAAIIEVQALSKQLDGLISQKDSLGIFHKKAKNELDNQIKEVEKKTNEFRKIINDTNLSLGKQMDVLKAKLKEIYNELEKDRLHTDENANNANEENTASMDIVTGFENVDS